MRALPDMHGWATAAQLARLLEVTPGTVRARARRGLIKSMTNPVGSGRLYALEVEDQGSAIPADTAGRANRANPASVETAALRRDDGYILTLLPSKPTEIERLTGLTRASVHRALRRLEAAGQARCVEVVEPGRQGGRPAQVWEAL